MTARHHPARRFDGDGGAVIVEAAIVLPLLLVLLAGSIDYGVGFRNRTLIQSATRNAARVGATAANNVSADQLALSTFYAGIASSARTSVTKVIVFRSDSIAAGEPNATCKAITPQATGAGNTSSACNVYRLSQIQAAAATPTTFVRAGTTCASTGWDRYWCPATRSNNLSGTINSLGFYAEVAYSPFTGVFGGDDLTITDSVVMRLEPTPG